MVCGKLFKSPMIGNKAMVLELLTYWYGQTDGWTDDGDHDI